MDKNTQLSIALIDKTIAQLTKTRNMLIGSQPLSTQVSNGDWVIQKSKNTYFKVNSKCTPLAVLTLERNNSYTEISSDRFNKDFRLAEKWEVEQHEQFLLTKQHLGFLKVKPQLPEFYMVTVKGLHGSKVRHETFERAVEEATKFSKLRNHRAHIMGVVAIIEPTQVQEPKTEYKLIKK